MPKYKIEEGEYGEGRTVNTETAAKKWEEAIRFDGQNYLSRATGSQWAHEMVYKNRKGRYWLESWSQWQGSTASARWMRDKDAAAWLEENEHELPADLACSEESRKRKEKTLEPRFTSLRDRLESDWETGAESSVWEVVVELMDPEIREQIHRELAPCSQSVFFAAYDAKDSELGDCRDF